MNAVQIDDWGRDWTAVPLPASVEADPALHAMVVALQRRVCALGARVVQLEACAAAEAGEFVPFEAQVYGWVGRLAGVVGDEWGVTSIEIVSARRTGDLIRPRFVMMWLVSQVSPMSLPQIGRLFGNRDHTSVRHGIKRVDDWRKAEESFEQLTNQLLLIARRLRTEGLTAAPKGGVE